MPITWKPAKKSLRSLRFKEAGLQSRHEFRYEAAALAADGMLAPHSELR